jgi:hypothetical protein
MKNALALLVLVIVGLTLTLGGTAAARTDGPTMAQFRQLKAQVVRIDKQVSSLESRIAALEKAPTQACLGSLGISEYDGYVYDLNDPFETTALSLPDSGDLPDWQMVIRTC